MASLGRRAAPPRELRERAWYKRGTGAFVLKSQMRLVQESLAPWPRRGSTLLEVNCAAGRLQELLWEQGFDVTGCDPSPALRALFRASLSQRFACRAASADLLPWGDGDFDWALVHLDAREDLERLGACLQEARRVVRRGFAVCFWNAFAPGARALAASRLRIPLASPLAVYRALRALGEGRIAMRSMLAGPLCSWKLCARGSGGTSAGLAARAALALNQPMPLCFGALAVMRFDLGPLVPLTPRPLLVRRLRLGEAALAGATQGEASASAAIQHSAIQRSAIQRSNLAVDIASEMGQTRL